MSDENDAPEAAPTGFAGFANAIGSRNLMIAIIAMPLVFIAVVTAAIAIFGRPEADEKVKSVEIGETSSVETLVQPRSATAALAAAAPPTAVDPIELEAGSDISAMALDGDRLALRISGPSGGEIVVYDLGRAEIIRRIPVVASDGL